MRSCDREVVQSEVTPRSKLPDWAVSVNGVNKRRSVHKVGEQWQAERFRMLSLDQAPMVTMCGRLKAHRLPASMPLPSEKGDVSSGYCADALEKRTLLITASMPCPPKMRMLLTNCTPLVPTEAGARVHKSPGQRDRRLINDECHMTMVLPAPCCRGKLVVRHSADIIVNTLI